MIEIVNAKKYPKSECGGPYWVCWLELTGDGEALWLPAAAPGKLEEAELQAYFDAREGHLWVAAQQKRYQPDVTLRLQERELLRRLVRVILSEINILRDAAGLPPRTLEQLKRALKEAR